MEDLKIDVIVRDKPFDWNVTFPLIVCSIILAIAFSGLFIIVTLISVLYWLWLGDIQVRYVGNILNIQSRYSSISVELDKVEMIIHNEFDFEPWWEKSHKTWTFKYSNNELFENGLKLNINKRLLNAALSDKIVWNSLDINSKEFSITKTVSNEEIKENILAIRNKSDDSLTSK